jgi:hypothetical protein
VNRDPPFRREQILPNAATVVLPRQRGGKKLNFDTIEEVEEAAA